MVGAGGIARGRCGPAPPERPKQVFELLQGSSDKQPQIIRRLLTEGSVRAADKRVRFIGIEAYVEAGGKGAARPVPGRRGLLGMRFLTFPTIRVYFTPYARFCRHERKLSHAYTRQRGSCRID